MRVVGIILLFLLGEGLYSLSVYFSASEKEVVLSENAIQGKLLFQKYNCVACHQFYGLGGYMGPDLTNVIASKGKEYAKSIILNGTGKMPKLDVSEEEAEKITEYLSAVSQTGKFPLQEKEFELTPWGTFNETINENRK